MTDTNFVGLEPQGAVKIIARGADGSEVDVTEDVAVMYDCVRQSLDWGSGFLDRDEVASILRVSRAAGYPDFVAALESAWQAERYGRGPLPPGGETWEAARSAYERDIFGERP